MTDNFQKMQAELVAVYEKWWNEVSQIGFDAEKYSNPFYCGIPSNW